MSLFNRSANLLSGWPKGARNRPPFEAAYVYALALFAGYMIADLGILYVRPNMLPTEPPPARPTKPARLRFTDVNQYSNVEHRNVFNQDGKIPAPITAGEGGINDTAVPVLSQLPLKLEGTLVHSKPEKSVATITAKGKNEARSYMADADVEGLAKITKIERRKVIIRNLNNGRLEFIEIPKDAAVTFAAKPTMVGEVAQRGDFDYTMRRGDINKYTANLGDVLQQARMVPNIVPGSGGRVDGFRFVAIQPGSIFEKLGFKPMDVIKRVNNEQVNSPTKAMELYNALKTESRLSLTVERNGHEEQFKYDIPD